MAQSSVIVWNDGEGVTSCPFRPVNSPKGCYTAWLSRSDVKESAVHARGEVRLRLGWSLVASLAQRTAASEHTAQHALHRVVSPPAGLRGGSLGKFVPRQREGRRRAPTALGAPPSPLARSNATGPSSRLLAVVHAQVFSPRPQSEVESMIGVA